jgi:putative transposase
MARPLRIEYPGAWYHVLNRGRRKESIFFSDEDNKMFFKTIEESCELFNIEVHAYSLLPNHYHILIQTPLGNLSRALRHLNGVYTQRINRKYKKEGSLFRGRFKSILIEKDNYFKEVVRYIHRNPYKAGLEEDIGSHRWTSHYAYMNKTKRPSWLKTEAVLLQFGERENEAIKALDSFVRKEEPKELSKMLDSLKWPAILGGEVFKNEIREKLKGKTVESREIPQYKESMQITSADKAIKMLEAGMMEKEVFSLKKSKKNSSKRKAAIYIFRQYLFIPSSEMREAFGGVSYAAISKQYNLAKEEIERKEGCYGEFKEMAGIFKLKIKT